MKEVIEKNIDGEDYSFYQLGAIKAHNLLLKIGKVIGPAFGAFANSGDIGKNDSILDAKIDFQVVVESLFERADEKVLESIILTLCKQIHHSGSGNLKTLEIIDLHFKGKLPTMYNVLYSALEAQFGDFLGEGGMLEKLRTKSKKGSPPAT